MKLISFFRSSTFYKPALAALLLAVSRLPLHLGFLVFFGFIPLFSLLQEKRHFKQMILAALVFSVVYTSTALHWISLVTIGGFIGLYFLFGLYFSILFIILNKAWNAFPKIRLLVFICFWMSFEYLQNFGEFRFPWFNVGYSLADYLPFIQPADLGGNYLLSVLLIIVSFLLFRLRHNFRQNIILLIGIIIIWSGYGFIRLKTINIELVDNKISIVQASIPQDKKWEKAYFDSTVARYEKLTRQAAKTDPDLIIWPESALPTYLLKNRKYKKLVLDLAKDTDSDIFLGLPHYKYRGNDHPSKYEFFNAATRFSKEGKIYPYYIKNILVPFGERIPFLRYFPFLWNVHLGQANWEYGTKPEFYDLNEYSYSPLICFEIAFEKLTTKMAQQNADFIVNITNDGWFKRSAGTYQHAVMAKFRAVETRRAIYRSANTGFSLVVSPSGEYLWKSKLYEQTVHTHDLVICRDKTFFTNYIPRYPFVFVLGAGIMLVWMIVRRFRRKGIGSGK